MFICSNVFAILDVPSRSNISLLYTAAKVTDPSFNRPFSKMVSTNSNNNNNNNNNIFYLNTVCFKANIAYGAV